MRPLRTEFPGATQAELFLLTKRKTPPWALLMERKRTSSRDTWRLINQNVRDVLILTGLFVGRMQRGGGESSQNPRKAYSFPLEQRGLQSLTNNRLPRDSTRNESQYSSVFILPSCVPRAFQLNQGKTIIEPIVQMRKLRRGDTRFTGQG